MSLNVQLYHFMRKLPLKSVPAPGSSDKLPVDLCVSFSVLSPEASSSYAPTITARPETERQKQDQSTNCTELTLKVIYDSEPTATWYELSKVGHNATFRREGKSGDKTYEQSFCLGEGRYEFTLGDYAGDWFEGRYSLTLKGGKTIINSIKDVSIKKTTTFDLPFMGVISYPTYSPTTYSPSTSQVSNALDIVPNGSFLTC